MIKHIFRTIHQRLKNIVSTESKENLRETPPRDHVQQGGAKRPVEKPRLETATPAKSPRRAQKPRRTKRPRTSQKPFKSPSKTEDGVSKDAWEIAQFQVPFCDGKLRFHDLELPVPLMHAIHDLGFQYCSPIQAEILPDILKGNDATGQAQTGTGKTAAFLIAIITRLFNRPRVDNSHKARPRTLILAPTRELVMQITEEANALAKYTPLKVVAVFGGMDYEKQRRMLHERPDILVATPGRLLDFHKQREVDLKELDILVIDEADRMLDMGFVPDVRLIIHATPSKSRRQTLLFSATLAPEVIGLAAKWTRQPTHVEIEPDQIAVDSVNQIVYITTTDEKLALLLYVITQQRLQRVLVFCNRRDETRKLTASLQRYGVNCALISGEIAQTKRIRTLEQFRSGKINVLVATDVAGRGLHIEGISHVINYTLPHDPEDYVHRIGRTGRAGATGTSISFACEEDSFYIPEIETFLGGALKCIHPDESWLKLPPLPRKKATAYFSSPPKRRHRPFKYRQRKGTQKKNANPNPKTKAP